MAAKGGGGGGCEKEQEEEVRKWLLCPRSYRSNIEALNFFWKNCEGNEGLEVDVW